jgi:hypothetical protein
MIVPAQIAPKFICCMCMIYGNPLPNINPWAPNPSKSNFAPSDNPST